MGRPASSAEPCAVQPRRRQAPSRCLGVRVCLVAIRAAELCFSFWIMDPGAGRTSRSFQFKIKLPLTTAKVGEGPPPLRGQPRCFQRVMAQYLALAGSVGCCEPHILLVTFRRFW